MTIGVGKLIMDILMDMCRMQAVLTEEQSHQISEFKVLFFPDDGHATDAGCVNGGAIA